MSNGSTGFPPLDIMLRRMGIAPATLRDERAPQAILSNFALRPTGRTADGRRCTQPLACSRLTEKTVKIVATFAQPTIMIEVSLPTGTADTGAQVVAPPAPLWVPLVTAINAAGVFAIQQGSTEITVQAIRISVTSPQNDFPADFQAFFMGLWFGPGPYCPRVAPYNLGGS